jgi:hypothetical protein
MSLIMNVSQKSNLRTDLRVIGYCLIVGLTVTSLGFDQSGISGFLAMKQFVTAPVRRWPITSDLNQICQGLWSL